MMIDNVLFTTYTFVYVRICIEINSLLHPCLCNNRFIRTAPSGLRPSGLVHINLLLHSQGCNNVYINHGHKVYMVDIPPLAEIKEACSRDKPQTKREVYQSCKLPTIEAEVVQYWPIKVCFILLECRLNAAYHRVLVSSFAVPLFCYYVQSTIDSFKRCICIVLMFERSVPSKHNKRNNQTHFRHTPEHTCHSALAICSSVHHWFPQFKPEGPSVVVVLRLHNKATCFPFLPVVFDLCTSHRAAQGTLAFLSTACYQLIPVFQLIVVVPAVYSVFTVYS